MYMVETQYGKKGQDNVKFTSGGLISVKATGEWEISYRGSKLECEAAAKVNRNWGHKSRVVKAV